MQSSGITATRSYRIVSVMPAKSNSSSPVESRRVMPTKKYKPTSPGRRGMTSTVRTESTKNKPHKPLLKKLNKSGGRDNRGHMAIVGDFDRDELGAIVTDIFGDWEAASESGAPSCVSRKGGPQFLVSSPCPGRSIFRISAPRSASNCVAQGPARIRAKSMTRMPSSAPIFAS